RVRTRASRSRPRLLSRAPGDLGGDGRDAERRGLAPVVPRHARTGRLVRRADRGSGALERRCRGPDVPPVPPGRANAARRPERPRRLHRPRSSPRPRCARPCAPRRRGLRAPRLARASSGTRCRGGGRPGLGRRSPQQGVARDRRVDPRPAARAHDARRGLRVRCRAARGRRRRRVRRRARSRRRLRPRPGDDRAQRSLGSSLRGGIRSLPRAVSRAQRSGDVMTQPLRLGIVSTAHINRLVIPGAHASEKVELVAVASRDLTRAQEYARTWKIERAYGSYEALLEDPDVEAVYISLPNTMHCEWSVRAVEAGKHVLCEKPLSRHTAEVEQAFDAAERAGRLLTEAFMYRHNPQTARLRQLVDEGAIGEPRVIRTAFSYSLYDPENIRLRADVEGGSLMDVGCYCVSGSRLLGGEPTSVYGRSFVGPTGTGWVFP